ncbi:MAG: hypothetical protein HDR53_00455 [Treponema sp.]|nr:hypothetical protein [Treponema sp.]
MLNNEGKYVCGMCGRVYDADDFEKAVDHEVERLKGEKQKQFKRFLDSGKVELIYKDQEYKNRDAYIEKLSYMKRLGECRQYCSEKCSDDAKRKRDVEATKEKLKKAKNRHNPFYIVKKNPIDFLMGIAQWGVPMFLFWRNFLPLSLIVILSVFISYISRWSEGYKFLNKFDLKEPIEKFAWIFAFIYALGGAIEAVSEIFSDFPYVIEDMFELIGRNLMYIPMVLLAFVITIVHPLLKKSVFKKISGKVTGRLELAAMFAISIFSMFHLLNHWIGFPTSVIIAVVGSVGAYKKFDDQGIAAICFANLVLSETLFV